MRSYIINNCIIDKDIGVYYLSDPTFNLDIILLHT